MLLVAVRVFQSGTLVPDWVNLRGCRFTWIDSTYYEGSWVYGREEGLGTKVWRAEWAIWHVHEHSNRLPVAK
jgi:hypothetical protein